MFKKILATSLLLSGLAFTHASFATTFNFEKYADEIYGEQGYGWDNPFFHTEDGLSVFALGIDLNNENDEAYAYLDSGKAGLGVCKKLSKNGTCAPSNDDNVGYNEVLGLLFIDSEDPYSGNLVDVKINKIVFKNANHGTTFGEQDKLLILATSETYDYGFTFDEYSLTYEFSTPLIGSAFSFATLQENTQFYISSIDVSEVPAPAPLALLAIGLMGIYSASRKKQKV